MSNSQLDEANSHKADEALAEALGISVDELSELNYDDIESEDSDDGITYRQYVEIYIEGSSEEVLEKVMENVDYDDNDDYITAYIDIDDSSSEEYEDLTIYPNSDNDDDLV
jgi:hypothetical protein